MSDLETSLETQLKILRINGYMREYQFCERRWRFDFAWPDRKLACEVEGGVYSHGRHTRGYGFEADCEKYNRASLDGWRVLRFTHKHIKNGEAINMIEQALKQ